MNEDSTVEAEAKGKQVREKDPRLVRLGARLRELREIKGLSRLEVISRSGIGSVYSLDHVEGGFRALRPEAMDRLVAVLGADPAEIAGLYGRLPTRLERWLLSNPKEIAALSAKIPSYFK